MPWNQEVRFVLQEEQERVSKFFSRCKHGGRLRLAGMGRFDVEIGLIQNKRFDLDNSVKIGSGPAAVIGDEGCNKCHWVLYPGRRSQ